MDKRNKEKIKEQIYNLKKNMIFGISWRKIAQKIDGIKTYNTAQKYYYEYLREKNLECPEETRKKFNQQLIIKKKEYAKNNNLNILDEIYLKFFGVDIFNKCKKIRKDCSLIILMNFDRFIEDVYLEENIFTGIINLEKMFNFLKQTKGLV